MANCAEKGKDDLRKCAEYRDNGHSECERYEDEGYNACDKWDQECCDWWPCSWGCKLVSWICLAWVWISNLVCKAWYWIANLVCVSWVVVVYVFCTIIDTAVTVLGAVVTVVESIFGWFADLFAWFVDLLLSIPILGRLLKLLLNAVLTIIWFIVSIPDAVIYLVGVRPEKKLRVCAILLCDERGSEVAKRDHVVAELNKAIQTFRQAHVRIVCNAPFQFRADLRRWTAPITAGSGGTVRKVETARMSSMSTAD